MRTGAGVAALAALLLLTGCSSDGGGEGKDAGGPPTAAGSGPGATESPEGDASTAPPAGDAGTADIEGSWTANTAGKLVVLTVQDDMAGVAGEHLCTGRAIRQGSITLDLKCANGDTDRAKGQVSPGADGRTLTVKWEGSGIEDKFSKAPSDAIPSEMPSGMPSDLPSGMPSDLPSMPKLPES
ncbi:hypothetical protein ACIQM4_09595 [Streptomyces sp. NPDC091272]|uniref:hypothetical protein n=1 Tax=Streptomyces sp. NPDC091272 TaxID=3365981 RepID=UPI0037F97A9B